MLIEFRRRNYVIFPKVLLHAKCVWSRLQKRPPHAKFYNLSTGEGHNQPLEGVVATELVCSQGFMFPLKIGLVVLPRHVNKSKRNASKFIKFQLFHTKTVLVTLFYDIIDCDVISFTVYSRLVNKLIWKKFEIRVFTI